MNVKKCLVKLPVDIICAPRFFPPFLIPVYTQAEKKTMLPVLRTESWLHTVIFSFCYLHIPKIRRLT